MAKRQSKPVITGVSQEQANEAFAQYAKSDASIKKINAEIELQCAKVREKYASKLAELDCDRETAFDTLQAYATENQAELFSKKKSLEMTHGTGEGIFAVVHPHERGDSQRQVTHRERNGGHGREDGEMWYLCNSGRDLLCRT